VDYIDESLHKQIKSMYRLGYFKTILNFLNPKNMYKIYDKLFDYKPFLIHFLNRFDKWSLK